MPDTSWTVMIYMAGDNNLSDESVYALTEMKKAAPGGRVKVVVQFDPKDDYLPTHRFEINRGGNRGALVEDMLSKAPFKPEDESSVARVIEARRGADAERETETDTGNPDTLFNFLSLCLERYPAEHYMVVIAGHGSGTERDFLLRDESPAGYLTINELKGVFRDLQSKFRDADGNPLVIDILGMDVCLMSMAEICYDLRGLVQIAVSNESYSPASGWPYQAALGRLPEFAKAGPGTPEKLEQERVGFARALVEEYVNFYSDYWLGGLSVDQSALDVRKVEGLGEVVRELAAALEAGLTQQASKDAIVLAHWEAQSYNGEQYVDLYDFCDCLLKRSAAGPVATACQRVKDFLSPGNFVVKSCYSGPEFQYSYGVSIYFPWDDVAPSYGSLDFAGSSGWGRFLQAYTKETRRGPRGVEKEPKLGIMNLTNEVRKVGGRKVGGRGRENPIRSMRNPPIVA
ncbi:MAG TPA: clostripain-related cysteine peptidase, partial [Pyrinomonadaceae bacterium]|nr:clostripain-related cysteine peptidase [Pyrinomonadaceae bacterium]